MFAISVLPYIFPLLAYVNTQEKNSDNKYCSLCFKPGTHTMCLYPKKGPGESCKGYSERVIDDQEKELILHYHNYYRNKVALGYAENDFGHQPPAVGMLQLMWHDELSEIAQRWADQCISFEDSAQHDACKMTKEFEAGQNIITIGTLSSRAMNHSEAIKDWYQEMLDYDPDWVGSYKGSVKPPKKIGHYTQLVWAKTQYVGCASVTFVDVVRRKKFWVNRLVCNYGPSGNIIDAAVYKVGLPCSKCPSYTSCSPHWRGLCATRQLRSIPPVLPVGFSETADWAQKKYRRPAWIDDVSIPSYSPIKLSDRKRVLGNGTSQSTTNDPKYFNTTLTTTVSSTMSPITTSLEPSKTFQSPPASSPLASLNAPITSNATSTITPTPGSPPVQSTTSSTTKQPTSSPPEHTYTRQTSSTRTPVSFPRTELPRRAPEWSNEVDGENAPRFSSPARRRGPQAKGYFRPRAVFQRWRRRWKGAVCLCPVKGSEGDEAFSKVDGVGRKGVRSRARTTVPGAALLISVLALMRLH